MIDDHHRIARGELRRIAERQRRRRERCDGADEAEAGRMVVGDDARRNALALLVDETHFVGFDDQIADRDDQSVVADHDASAFALLAESRAAARVGRPLAS